ncbi:hypothetical protein NPIL_513591 [Nephila pilipes]|uniref:Uncharacterized protein n=1 Tax=Nephila pilipes TaxID=299642 RepID=A0A8X6Q5A9_NEPPI|nr:hypothetical protein NPIL_513591 [Nephila pilipes]
MHIRELMESCHSHFVRVRIGGDRDREYRGAVHSRVQLSHLARTPEGARTPIDLQGPGSRYALFKTRRQPSPLTETRENIIPKKILESHPNEKEATIGNDTPLVRGVDPETSHDERRRLNRRRETPYGRAPTEEETTAQSPERNAPNPKPEPDTRTERTKAPDDPCPRKGSPTPRTPESESQEPVRTRTSRPLVPHGHNSPTSSPPV